MTAQMSHGLGWICGTFYLFWSRIGINLQFKYETRNCFKVRSGVYNWWNKNGQVFEGNRFLKSVEDNQWKEIKKVFYISTPHCANYKGMVQESAVPFALPQGPVILCVEILIYHFVTLLHKTVSQGGSLYRKYEASKIQQIFETIFISRQFHIFCN